ncbi:MAG: methionyl-tRNA formyltransferase [Candidatus Omnitrophica bacterium]|nr:methionyl-tRNA formyltransferase [Candidatus Omnitrophota bacterium]
MKIIFFGTSDFAIPSLEVLLRSGHDLVSVVTQPDKPGGRNRELLQGPVKQWASAASLPTLQPEELSDFSFMMGLKKMSPELFVVVSYGKILPPFLLALPPHGAINVHPSLLPKYRGASPIPWAILNGDSKTGISILRMTEKVDAGEILLQKEVGIGKEEDASQLSKRLSALGGELLLELLRKIEKGEVEAFPQKGVVTFAPRFKKEEGRIDWRRSAEELSRQIRALVPWPGSFTLLHGKRWVVWKGKAIGEKREGKPGEIVGLGPEGIAVATGKGKLLLEEIQLEGKEKMKSGSFLLGHPLRLGETFSCNP